MRRCIVCKDEKPMAAFEKIGDRVCYDCKKVIAKAEVK